MKKKLIRLSNYRSIKPLGLIVWIIFFEHLCTFTFSQCAEYYGMTELGGESDNGAIYSLSDNSNNIKEYDPFISYGAVPNGLIKTEDGRFIGGNASGIIFEWNPETNEYSILYRTTNWLNDPVSCPLLKLSSSRMIGVSNSGGKYGDVTGHGDFIPYGVIFEYNPVSNTYSKKFDFNFSDGTHPINSLVLAGNGKLYGLTSGGGSYKYGGLYEWNPNGDIFVKKMDFDRDTKGAFANSLVMAGNGKLYGCTSYGGGYDHGVLFEWDPLTDVYTKKIDFNDTVTGKHPNGVLILADNGKLYGCTREGGLFNKGVIYEYDINSDTFRKRIDFNGTDNGSYPDGLIQLKNHSIFGSTTNGGKYDNGIFFNWNYNDDTIIVKLSFEGETGGSTYFSFVLEEDNKLYGYSPYGGTYNEGFLFEWNLIQDTLVKRFEFGSKINGRNPSGSLVMAPNGKLYGMVSFGGVNNMGTLFEWDTESKTLTKKIDFDANLHGAGPLGSLTLAYNGKLYGMNATGGKYNHGTLFEWDLGNEIFTKKIDFNGMNGAYPEGSLLQCSNGKLYGTTSKGGNFDEGVIFEWDIKTNKYTKLIDIDQTLGGYAPVELIELPDRRLYGVIKYGYDNYGAILEYDIDRNTLLKKYEFNRNENANGKHPVGKLLSANNGKIYGITQNGGQNNGGVLFEYDVLKDSITPKYSFGTAESGSYPVGSLLQISEDTLMGVTQYGGSNSGGIVYKFNIRTNNIRKIFDFNVDSLGKGKYPVWGIVKINKSNKILFAEDCNSYTSPSGKYTWSTSGIYYDTIPNPSGCDTIITIHLTLGKTSSYISETVCEQFTSPSGKIWTTSGTFTDTIPNAAGCDSIITIRLTINHSTYDTVSPVVCETYISPSGRKYISSGTYFDTIPNSCGCDSIININLTVNHNTTTTLQPKTCNTYTSPSGQYVWEQSGTYLDTIPNACGCDSIITIKLNLQHIDPTVSLMLDGAELVSNDALAHHQWVDCDQDFKPIAGQTGQSFTPTQSGNYAVVVSYGWCTETSECIQVTTTGMEPNTPETGIKIYPNPTSERFSIDLGREYKKASISISQLDGRLVQKKQVEDSQQIEFDIESQAGIYLLTITTSNENLVFRIVKK